MKEYILTCSCFKMDKKASEAFSLKFPKKVLPEMVRGRDKIYKLSLELKNDHIKAISKLSGKYAYYTVLDNGIIIEEHDLLRGRRIY